MKRTVLLLATSLWWTQGCAGLTKATDTAGQVGEQAGKAKDAADKGKSESEKAGGGRKGGGDEGGDDDRLHAREADINAPLDDRVDAKKDKVDWRKVKLTGKPGIATFELHWDEESANLDVDVYNSFGDNIGKSPPRLEGQQTKKVLIEVGEPGLFYVRVSTVGKKDTSIYTLEVKWKGAPPEVVAPAATSAPAAPAAAGPAAGPAAPASSAAPPADPNKVPGSILSVYREGGQLVLYIDKGSAAKLKPGMTGTILEGPEGDKPLEGASFTIHQVLGEAKSVARSSFAKPLGKNKRIVVNLK